MGRPKQTHSLSPMNPGIVILEYACVTKKEEIH